MRTLKPRSNAQTRTAAPRKAAQPAQVTRKLRRSESRKPVAPRKVAQPAPRKPAQPAQPPPPQRHIEGAQGRILTAHGVADLLRCHYTTVYRLMRAEQLPAFRLGSDYRFLEADIFTWIDQRTTGRTLARSANE